MGIDPGTATVGYGRRPIHAARLFPNISARAPFKNAIVYVRRQATEYDSRLTCMEIIDQFKPDILSVEAIFF